MATITTYLYSMIINCVVYRLQSTLHLHAMIGLSSSAEWQPDVSIGGLHATVIGTRPKPSTHRRRRRDSTVKLGRVGGVHWFATSLRRIWSKNWKLNMLRIYPVELAAELETPKLGHDCRVPTAAQYDSTRQLGLVGVGGVYMLL